MPAFAPAIAESDDLYAWLIRGFVESGLPDHTRGGREWTATGALNLENFIQEQGGGGIVLEFRGQAGDDPSPEDEYTYQVSVVRGAQGTEVVVRCAETLFHHAFPLGGERGDGLAGYILGQLRAHNDAFTDWRAKGGETTYAQRIGIPEVKGTTCDRALVTVLETLRRANRSVVEGPANKWWVKGPSAGSVTKIEAGLGMEPEYRTTKAMVNVSPEDLAYARRLRGAGMLLILSGIASMGFLTLGLAFAGYNVYTVGTRGITSQPWLVASLLGTLVFGAVQVFGGVRLRALRSKGLVRVLAVLGMLPCLAPCCGVGIPVGAWVLYLLHDARSSKVFSD
ncbi:MAG: hypothetical protein Q7U06_01725 [Pseudomonadota bacterium]|nr:hypothetical protein [Pseudomonadota bacterium]